MLSFETMFLQDEGLNIMMRIESSLLLYLIYCYTVSFNDLFKTKKEPLSTSKSIKEPLESIIKQDEPKQQPITKNEPLVESIIELEKTTPSKPASKPVGGKNLLFNPAALKSRQIIFNY